ncbi:ABC transporter ATP-binding protein [Amycolatopsis rhabdoformis]|uniref:ABC transporter ATP-binding protein n=1 Tax=Amycolatopsis rhabdoformis TaxID=1448059 RepID=A0ABZ1ICL3_9PSEU|nr:ABC transporter ATP-binding protein [Amycolatopsis rhabdoformis]WSE32205.1 ABC transporter ATP-binding protein [Amycolatopsis rhabdoformis]
MCPEVVARPDFGGASVALGGAGLTLAGIGKDFPDRSGAPGGLIALDGVDLTVRPGEFVAVVGPSGCGKTTLLRLIAGMTDPSRGSIVVGAGEVRDARTGFVFQHASLYPWRTVLQNVAFGLELRAREPRRSRRTRRAVRARAAELVELVGLGGFESYFPHQISGGMQQRANLARALAIAPELLLMDEPFSALDAQTREELQIELQRIAVEANTTTVFVTHDIGEALYLADRVVVLTGRPGRIKEVLTCPTARPRPLSYQVSHEFLGLRDRAWSLVHRD